MFQVWTAVAVTTEGHPRQGEVGIVHTTNREKHPNEVIVKFDLAGDLETVEIADLKAL